MSDTAVGLRRKIASASDLQSVVRTMKALAASSIGQYETAVRALADYYRTVELGLGVCLGAEGPTGLSIEKKRGLARQVIGAVVFGSDQGLVGQFNEDIADFAAKALAGLEGRVHLFSVGERVHMRLADWGASPAEILSVPSCVEAIGPLVGEILVQTEMRLRPLEIAELHLFHHRPTLGGIYAPVAHRLLPLDEAWRRRLVDLPWPTARRPEILGGGTSTLRALIREYLFISIYRACAESLVSENASRLSAMQRADRNIEELLEALGAAFHRLRQSTIDAELFDVISGVEALST